MYTQLYGKGLLGELDLVVAEAEKAPTGQRQAESDLVQVLSTRAAEGGVSPTACLYKGLGKGTPYSAGPKYPVLL